MKKQMLKLFCVLCLCVTAFALIACSDKNNARQAEAAALVAELETAQPVQQVAKVETAEAVTEETEIAAQPPIEEPLAAPEQITPPPQQSATAEAVAQAAPTPAAPPPATTPRYAIGDTGPNGGIVFSASGGRYKEMYISREASNSMNPDVTVVVNGGFDFSANRFRYGGYSAWRPPTIQELVQFYEIIIASGKAQFGDKLVCSQTKEGEPITEAPGYFMYYAGSGFSYYFMTLNDGKIWTETTYTAEYGNAAWNAVPMFWAIVRSF